MSYDKKNLKKDLLLYGVTDRTWVGQQSLKDQVESALKGGATMIQLREKNLSENEFLKEAIEINKLCMSYKVPLLINDNAEIAAKCGAAGVHVGQDDTGARQARIILGPKKIIGVTAHSVEEAVEAQRRGADYLGVGALFATGPKQDATPISYETIRAICDAVTIPVVAIGGISADNMTYLKDTGIRGVALVSAIFGAKDIEEECRLLKNKISQVVGGYAMNSTKGAIFDMDGTLLDSMYIWQSAGKNYLKSIGIEPRPDLNDHFLNKSLQQACTYLKEAYDLSLSVEEIMAGVNKSIETIYFTEVEKKEGVEEYLKKLEARGIPMCIASATDEYLVDGVLRRTGLRKYFKKIFTCTGVGAGKNQPLIFQECAEFLGTEVCETMVFEDALYAAKTAKEAGFLLTAVYDEAEQDNQEALKAIADQYIYDFRKVDI